MPTGTLLTASRGGPTRPLKGVGNEHLELDAGGGCDRTAASRDTVADVECGKEEAMTELAGWREALQQMALDNARARWSDGGTQFVLDDTIPPGEVYFLNAPLNPDSVAARIQRGEFSRVAGLANGEPLTPATCHRCGEKGPCVPRPCGARECHSAVCIDLCVTCVGQANGYNRPPTGLPRMEWRAYGDGDGRGLQRCEGCHAWRPCRRAAIAEPRPISFSLDTFDLTGPATREAYYCYDCARR